VTKPADNPPIELRCNPLKVELMLNESFSISGAATTATRDAALGFVNSLYDSGAELGIVAFSQRARVGVSYEAVNSGSLSTFTNWINNAPGSNGYNPAGTTTNVTTGTNWNTAFAAVTGAPSLVVFVTDGAPDNGKRACLASAKFGQ
jgi:von Willebrand factor type A domain